MVEETAELETVLAFHLIPGIGRVRFERLEDVFGSARAALNAPISRLKKVRGIGSRYAEQIVSARACDEARAEIGRAADNDIKIITYNHPDYPPTLLKSADPPLVLYVKGELRAEDALSVAIVGTRRCTHYGRQAAERIARGLVREGFCIISGMARGVDTAAHYGALSLDSGRTVAVLGSGLLQIYPPENEPLFEKIVGRGAVISEFRLDEKPDRGNFPRRNRIIAWMSLGTVVVEGDVRSGALITARHALEENREVFAVPGRIDTPQSRGPHRLIRDGAKLVQSSKDIIEELEPMLESPAEIAGHLEENVAEQDSEEPLFDGGKFQTVEQSPGKNSLNEGESPSKSPRGDIFSIEERRVIDAFEGPEPIHVDELIRLSGLDAGTVSGTLTILEIRRRIMRLPGNFYTLKSAAMEDGRGR